MVQQTITRYVQGCYRKCRFLSVSQKKRHSWYLANPDFCSKVWDTYTGECLNTFAHSHIVRSVALSPQQQPQYLLTVGRALFFSPFFSLSLDRMTGRERKENPTVRPWQTRCPTPRTRQLRRRQLVPRHDSLPRLGRRTRWRRRDQRIRGWARSLVGFADAGADK